MKQLTIDWHALEMAYDHRADEFEMECADYIDRQSGRVIFVDEEINSSARSIIDELEESLDDETDVTEEAIRGTSGFQLLSETEQANVLAALEMEYGDPNRFAEIPRWDSQESYRWMREFIETVDDEGLRGRLSNAVSQQRPFRRFHDVLADDRRMNRRWQEFEAARQRQTIIEWLHGIGIEPANPDAVTYDPPPLPDLRQIMFAEIRRFVRLARDLEGVRRIALIGSLATDKEFPKDVDLLVTVSDDCDLAPLAKLARQLSGHMNSHSAGADVFLASAGGEYLGRTCPWRDCGPGVRASCDALHCGRRPYLHDDLNAIRLKKDVITQPPVLLWPNRAARPDVPPDVHAQLLQQLAADDAS